MTSFAELTKQVHLINDLILADMTCDDFDSSKDALTFSKHLLATKYWFARISYPNKKKYLLALLHDVRSAWALSLLLKSMWNCRPKDAVLSVSERHVYTSYDQVPLDHNRTAMPAHTLAQVMKNDRIWIHSLDPEPQALVLSELTTVAGGPAIWEVLRYAQRLFERNRDLMLKNLLECIVINDQTASQKTDQSQNRDAAASGDAKQAGSSAPLPSPSEAEKAKIAIRAIYSLRRRDSQRELFKDINIIKSVETTIKNVCVSWSDVTPAAHVISSKLEKLEESLKIWTGTIKSMRDSLKLEELEMIFNDGSKRKIWKVNRPKPENIETVDLVQLLPSAIGKKIFAYLPRAQLGDYAKVNKYWAYLVDELRAELAARSKINADHERLHELLLRHDTSLEFFDTVNERASPNSIGMSATLPAPHVRQMQPSLRPSEKSAGAYSHRQFISEKLTKPAIIQKPIRNLAELSERLDRRGAADENIWKWCDCVLAHAKRYKKFRQKTDKGGSGGGVLSLGHVHFPCPLMKVTMQLPLDPPMYKDPIMTTSAKPRRMMSDYNLVHAPKETVKRYSLWTKDLSNLYRVVKIPSYLSPENMIAGAMAGKKP